MDLSSVNDAIDFNKCLDGKTVEAKVVSVYDGDSIKVLFPLNGVLYKWTCRLDGIDTPEIRTSKLQEKELGFKVRELLRDKILNKIVQLNCKTMDKYGRLLVTVIHQETNINQWLIDNEYAYEYHGGRKKSW